MNARLPTITGTVWYARDPVYKLIIIIIIKRARTFTKSSLCINKAAVEKVN